MTGLRVLVLVADDLYVRSFIRSGGLDPLERKGTSWAASEHVRNAGDLERFASYLGTIGDPLERREPYGRLQGLMMFAARRRSATWQIRMAALPDRERRRTALLALPPVRQIKSRMILRELGLNGELHALLAGTRPDALVIPTAGTDILMFDALRSAKVLRIPTVLLVNGWDNVASKCFFPETPARLGVWGDESAEEAVRIHRVPRDRVVSVGAPTFVDHFAFDSERSPSPYEHPYVLFAGCALPFDELTALRALDREIGRAGVPGLKVVYRPHPWRKPRLCDDVFIPESFENVVLDRQVERNYLMSVETGQREPADFLPDLDYYPALLGHARAVICPLSTMTLEACIVETPVVAIAYDDGIHPEPPSTVARFDHFRGIEAVPGVTMCRSLEDLPALVAGATAAGPQRGMRPAIRPWLHFDERSYGQRVAEVVGSVA